MGKSAVQLDRVPASGRSPAGPQSNRNVWVLPAISRDALVVARVAGHFAVDEQLTDCELRLLDHELANFVL